MSRSNNYAKENFSDFSYTQNPYKFISIDLSWKTNMSIPQQVIFTGKLKVDDSAPISFIAEKQQKIILNFSSDSLIVIDINIVISKKILNILNKPNDSKFLTENGSL